LSGIIGKRFLSISDAIEKETRKANELGKAKSMRVAEKKRERRDTLV
jgi:hypothetical protein